MEWVSAWLQNLKLLGYKSDDSKAKRSLSEWLPSKNWPFYEFLQQRLGLPSVHTVLEYTFFFSGCLLVRLCASVLRGRGVTTHSDSAEQQHCLWSGVENEWKAFLGKRKDPVIQMSWWQNHSNHKQGFNPPTPHQHYLPNVPGSWPQFSKHWSTYFS